MPAPRERGPAHTPPPHRARASRGAGQRDRWHPDREMKRRLDSSGTDRLLWKWLEEGQQQDGLSRGESAPPPRPRRPLTNVFRVKAWTHPTPAASHRSICECHCAFTGSRLEAAGGTARISTET